MPLIGLGVFFVLPWPLAVPVYLPVAGGSFLLYRQLMRDMQKPAVTGQQGILGKTVQVLEANGNGRYRVRLGSESWFARSYQKLHPGDRAQVTGVQGLVLVLGAVDGTDPPTGD